MRITQSKERKEAVLRLAKDREERREHKKKVLMLKRKQELDLLRSNVIGIEAIAETKEITSKKVSKK